MADYKAVWIDDDSTLVAAGSDILRHLFAERNIEFHSFTTMQESKAWIEENTGIIVLAIIDLWMIDKSTNKPEVKAGFNLIEAIRKRSPRAYIIIYSAHLNDEIISSLKRQYDNMAIMSKPAPAHVLEASLIKILDGQQL